MMISYSGILVQTQVVQQLQGLDRKGIRMTVLQSTLSRICLAFALALASIAFVPRAAIAQDAPLLEAGAGYNYVRSNAPPSGCGCFSLNGGSGWVAYNFNSAFGAVAEVAGQHASNINSTGTDLTLTSYLFGPRYTYRKHPRLTPFAQALFGGAHANGALAAGSSSTANAFALATGGGLDFSLRPRLALRLIQADYFYTRFTNGINDHQNNLRISAGVVFRWGTK